MTIELSAYLDICKHLPTEQTNSANRPQPSTKNSRSRTERDVTATKDEAVRVGDAMDAQDRAAGAIERATANVDDAKETRVAGS